MAILNQKRIKEIFDYREDGVLIRKEFLGNQINIGDGAGCDTGTGYLSTSVENKLYLVHRLVWLWHNGYLPEHGIDHINRIRNDNRIENLREATQRCNLRNCGNFSHNTSGVKGVNFIKDTKKWRAYIKIDQVNINITNTAESFEDAVFHRFAAEQCVNWESFDVMSPAHKYVKTCLKSDMTDY